MTDYTTDHGGPLDETPEFWQARWKEAADRADARDLAAHLWKETARHLWRAREVVRLTADLETTRADKNRDLAVKWQMEALKHQRAEQERAEAVEALDTTMARAIKAERERDREHDLMRNWRAAAEDRKDEIEALAAEPRALTPEDVTPDMMNRFITAYTNTRGSAGNAIRAGVNAMLTEPPKRPEWEQESAERIRGAVWGVDLPSEAGETGAVIAARLAHHGYKVVPLSDEDGHTPACEGDESLPCDICGSHWTGDGEGEA